MQTAQEAQTIAHTIKGQIGQMTLWSFAATEMTYYPETETVLGGLRFNFSNCPKIKKGTCEVLLMPDDTYSIIIRNHLDNVLFEAKGVYADQLNEILMEKIG